MRREDVTRLLHKLMELPNWPSTETEREALLDIILITMGADKVREVVNLLQDSLERWSADPNATNP